MFIRSHIISLCPIVPYVFFLSFFFFNDTATTEIYTLSLHDALPISCLAAAGSATSNNNSPAMQGQGATVVVDRKSTRLNSSHGYISYAVFCLKKKKNQKIPKLRYDKTTPYIHQ